jgi:3,4-dihydroxy-2-butanone 4-phosphate synthase
MSSLVVTGEIVHGDQRGRLLGFPTANVRLQGSSLPRFGVYAGRLDGSPAAISVGVRPTFGDDLQPLLEAHVLDFTGDLYGRKVSVELLEFIRDEQQFDDAESLVERMRDDVRRVRDVIADHDRGAEDRVQRAAASLARGEMVVLDGSRVMQGVSHLIVAAEHADAAAINRMAADARGLVSLVMTERHCTQLGLAPQREGRHPASIFPFTTSIEARRGVTTGISAHDRAVTVAAAIAPDASSADIVVPGHVFPVPAAVGGVLERPRHAEAAIDLARAARLRPAIVICTMLADDGDVADRDAVAAYADRHGLEVLTLADVLAFRRAAARRNALLPDGDA